MVLVFATTNLCEFFLIAKLSDGLISSYLLRCYYIASTASVAYLLFYCLDIGGIRCKWLRKATALTAISISAAILFTDAVIAGAVSASYTVTASQGDLYSVFRLYGLIGLALSALMLGVGYLKSETRAQQIQRAYTLFAISPLVFASVSVIALMYFGSSLTGAIILPFASSAFLMLTIITESPVHLSKMLKRFPASFTNKTSLHTRNITNRFVDGDLDYMQAKNEFEKGILIHKLAEFKGNKTAVADNIGVDRTTIYSMINRLDIHN
jgi:hypothetical protein